MNEQCERDTKKGPNTFSQMRKLKTLLRAK